VTSERARPHNSLLHPTAARWTDSAICRRGRGVVVVIVALLMVGAGER
jgi:hypothetical protein